jgi:hypothetical protein
MQTICEHSLNWVNGRLLEVQMFRKSEEAILEMQYSSKKYMSKNVHVLLLLQRDSR